MQLSRFIIRTFFCYASLIWLASAGFRAAVLHRQQERNHQGLANQIIRPESNSLPSTGTSGRHMHLGGRPNYYHREVA